MLRLTLIVVVLVLAAFPTLALDNLLVDPGFESVDEAGAFASWTLAPGSAGELQVAAQARSGQRAALLIPALMDGAHTAALRCWRVRPLWGARYRASVWCSGTGSARVGIMQQFRVRRQGEVEFETTWCDPAVLHEGWQRLTVEQSLLSDREVARIWLVLEAQGEGAAVLCDDAELVICRELTVTPPYAMVREGDNCDFTVTLSREGQPLTESALTVRTTSGQKVQTAELRVTAPTTVYHFSAPTTPDDRLFRLDFQSEELGVRQTVFLHVLDAPTWSQFAQAAAGAHIRTPAHLLIIGDSLSDLDRGHNWADQVAFWLGKTHAGQVTYRNAAVGGDFITRVWERLESKAGAYRDYMYDDLFLPPPTLTFIFLGHNDSKLVPKPEFRSPDDYTDPVVPFADWDSGMRRAVQYFRAQSGGEVVLLSNTSSVYEVCAQRVTNNLAAGKSGGSLFGKPEVMQRFNDILRQVAVDLGASFVDVYTPTLQHPDKPSLFLPDGVHINQAGNWLVALEVLRALADGG